MPTQLVADDFENDTIHADWADSTNFAIHASGYMYVQNSGNHPNRRNNVTPDAGQYAEAIIEADASSAAQMGCMCRQSASDLSGYGFMFRRSGNSEIFRTNSSGTDTTLGASFNETATTSATFRLEVETIAGDVEVRLYKNGSLIQTRTDTSGSKITAAGRLGVFGNGGSSTTRMLSWSGGNLAASGPTGTSAMTGPIAVMAAAGSTKKTGTAAFTAPLGQMFVPLNHPGVAAFVAPKGVMAASGARIRPPNFIDHFTTGLFNPVISTYDPNWKLDNGDAVKVWEDHAYCNDPAAEGCSATYRGVNWSGDHYAQATMVGGDNFTQYSGVSVRHQALGQGQYYGYWSNGQSAKFFRSDFDSSNDVVSLTDLVGSPAVAHQGDVVRLECQGTTLRLYINNVLQHTTTDSSYSGGTPGICGRNSTNTGRGVDDWGGSNLADIVVTGTAAFTAPKGLMSSAATRSRTNVIDFQAPRPVMAASGTKSSPVATQSSAKWMSAARIRYTNGADICRPIVAAMVDMGLANQALPDNQKKDIDRVEFFIQYNGGTSETKTASSRADRKPTDVTDNDLLPGWVASGGTGAFPVAAAFSVDIVMNTIPTGRFLITPTVIPANGTPITLETLEFYNHSGGQTFVKTGVVRYVSTTGSDGNNGLGTGTPKATIGAAAHDMKSASGDVSDGTIYLMGQDTLHAWAGGTGSGSLNCFDGGHLHIRPAPGVTRVRITGDNDSIGLRCSGPEALGVWFHRGVVQEGGLARFSDDPSKTTWIIDQTEKCAAPADIMTPASIRIRSAHYTTGEPWYMMAGGTKRDAYLGANFHDISLGAWSAYLVRGCIYADILGITFSDNHAVCNVDIKRIGRVKRGYVNQSNIPVNITVPSAGVMRIAERTAGALVFLSPSPNLQDIGVALAGSTSVHLQVSGAASQNNGHFVVVGGGVGLGGVKYVDVTNPSVIQEAVNCNLNVQSSSGQDWSTLIHNDVVLFSQATSDALYWCVRATQVDNEGRGIGSGSPLSRIHFFSCAFEYGDFSFGGSLFNAHCFENSGTWDNIALRRCTFRGDVDIYLPNQNGTNVEFSESVFDTVGLLTGVSTGSLASNWRCSRNHFADGQNVFGAGATQGSVWIGTLGDGNLQVAPTSTARGSAQYPTGSQWDLHDAGVLQHVASGNWVLAAVSPGVAGFVAPRPVMASAGVCRHTGTAAFVAPKGLLSASGTGTLHIKTGTAAFTAPRAVMNGEAVKHTHQVGNTAFMAPLAVMVAVGRGPSTTKPPTPPLTITERVYNAIYDVAKAMPYYPIKIGSITIDTTTVVKPTKITLAETETDWQVAKRYGRARVDERKRWIWILKLSFDRRVSISALEQRMSDSPISVLPDLAANTSGALVRMVHSEYDRGPEQDGRGDVHTITFEASTYR